MKIQESKIIVESTENIKNVMPSLSNNYEYIKNLFNKSADIVYYEFEPASGIKALAVFINDMIKREEFNNVLCCISESTISIKNVEYIEKYFLSFGMKPIKEFSNILIELLNGSFAIFVEGLKYCFVKKTPDFKGRTIEEPSTEKVSRGPKEGFIESIDVNRTLLRRQIKNNNLVFEEITIGKQTATRINIAYIKNIADQKIIDELKSRLNKIEIDSVLDSGYIEEFISDSPLSIFRTINHTERPDTVAGKLLEGRLALICDGSPIVLTMPFLFLENFQANEDYYNNFLLGSINRIIRLVCFFLTTLTPGLYISLTTYNQEMIPNKLLFSIISSREGVPLPTVLEVLIMIFVFELLKETGIRVPGPLGQTISFVGALILGTAAVEAKFVSAPVVIIVAITGISSFAIFKLDTASIIIRLILSILSAFMGLYGLILGVAVIFTHMVSIKSFGILYVSSLASFNIDYLKDTYIRAPWWNMISRPRFLAKKNVKRVGGGSSR